MIIGPPGLPAGKYFKSKGTIEPCTIGNYCPVGTKYVPYKCSIGSYCPEGSELDKKCPVGSYCPTPSEIRTCSVGTYSNITGITSQSQCVNCTEAGKYCSNGLQLPCEAGYYCPGNGIKKDCPIGSYCPAGSSMHTPCPDSKTTRGTNKTKVEDCFISTGNKCSKSSECVDQCCGYASNKSDEKLSCGRPYKPRYNSWGGTYDGPDIWSIDGTEKTPTNAYWNGCY